MDITHKIINYIKINRVSTSEVTDALDKTGELAFGLRPVVPGSRAVGLVHYVPAVNGSNWHVHKYVRDTPKDSIVFIDVQNCRERAIIGSLVAKYVLLYKQAQGIVVTGKVRDVHELIKEKYPIWSIGYSPIGCINTEVEFNEEEYEKRKSFYEGALIVADDSGVVLVKKEQLNEQFLQRLHDIEVQEDIWFDCIDRLKWDTFDTVCLKKYLNIN